MLYFVGLQSCNTTTVVELIFFWGGGDKNFDRITYTGCFTTLGHKCRVYFLGLCDEKSSYKHVSDFGRLRSYDRLKLRIEGNDY